MAKSSGKYRRTSLNNGKWQWNASRLLACRLIVEASLPEYEIARRCGVSRESIDNWKNIPDFKDRMQEQLAKIDEQQLKIGIANRARRLAALQKLHDKQMGIVAQRSVDPKLTELDDKGFPIIPGGDTGLVVRKERTRIVDYDEGQPIFGSEVEYSFDHALSKEIRATLEDAAIETGQRTLKTDITQNGMVNVTLTHQLGEALTEYLRAVREARSLMPAKVVDVTPAHQNGAA